MSKNVASGVQQTAQMLKDTTGFDVIEMLKGYGKSTPVTDTLSTGKTLATGNGAVKDPAGPH
jgi:flotillin